MKQMAEATGQTPERAALYDTALEKAKQADPLVQAATDALGQENLAAAIAKAREARIPLKQMQEALAPSNSTNALRDAERKLDQMVADQREAIAKTTAIASPAPMETILAKGVQDPKSSIARAAARLKRVAPTLTPEAVLAQLKTDPSLQGAYNQALKQEAAAAGEVANRLEDLAGQSRDLSDAVRDATVAEPLKAAENQLDAARAAAKPADPKARPDLASVRTAEQAALERLQAAQAAVQGALAKAEATAPALDSAKQSANESEPAQGNSLKQASDETLSDLQAQTHQLAGEQRQLAQRAKEALRANETPEQRRSSIAGDEAALRKRVEQVRQRAANASSAAETGLAAAVDAMKHAEAAPNPAMQAQPAQAARADLENAERQLAADQNQRKADMQFLEAVPKAQAALAALTDEERKLELETIQAANQADSAKTNALRSEQVKIKSDAVKSTKALPPGKEPGRALADAIREMENAHKAMWREKHTGEAQAAERAAITDLQKASAALADDANAMRKKLGMAPEKPQTDPSEAGHRLARAQAEIDAALAQLDKAGNSKQAGQPPLGAGNKAAQGQPGANRGKGRKGNRNEPEPGADPMQKAAEQLKGASDDVQSAQTEPALPQPLQAMLAGARKALSEAGKNTDQANRAGAQASAKQARAELEQAQAAMAELQAGINSPDETGKGETANGNQEAEQGGKDGKGDAAQAKQMAASGKGSKPEASAKGQMADAQQKRNPRPDPAQTKSAQAGGIPNHHNNRSAEAMQKGHGEVAKIKAQYIGLPPRDRAVIEQSQSEKYPEEYGPLVEQYMRNLADRPREQGK